MSYSVYLTYGVTNLTWLTGNRGYLSERPYLSGKGMGGEVATHVNMGKGTGIIILNVYTGTSVSVSYLSSTCRHL